MMYSVFRSALRGSQCLRSVFRHRISSFRFSTSHSKNLSHPLPRAILAILYKETHAGDGILAAKTDETYRGAGRRAPH
jgi:hypothetical protein